ncbi:LysR family transcriptional regulator [Bradyrhizobium cenepequi]|uniref:LysR family transcriptional regulator n=1 Tax=Bradyrhizobium cenepequi TaxID=2821403 RepID=UPI001CE35E89|nr:LysR family transcriptional regulator [Bradyrhizobium cenepequi]MCA6111192.1 LysR family transcriptional regulator [Bradyrhizobium cenepequi]
MRASLAELEAVAAVARHGGFRAAARELGASSSALSHAVAALEERLAARLFNRTTRSVSLTAAGELFVTEIVPALRSIERAMDEVGAHANEPSGRLLINTSPGAAHMMLHPIILEYARRYPRVTVEVVTESALVDITGAGFDAGARLADAIPPDMIAVPIFPRLRMIVVGAPSYLTGRPLPSVPADLLEHICVGMRLASGRLYRWEFERRGETMRIDVRSNLILDSTDLILSAALEGAGLAHIEEGRARPHIAAGRLVQLLDEWTPPFPGLSLYFAGRRHIPRKLQALVDLIRERASPGGRSSGATNHFHESL